MPREAQSDFFQGLYFMAWADNRDGGFNFLDRGPESLVEAPAGFSEISIPNVSTEIAEYREGSMLNTRKQPGVPTVGDATFSRGIARKDTSFYRWAVLLRESKGNYRSDVRVEQYHRSVSMPRDFSPDMSVGQGTNRTFIDPNAKAGRTYWFNEAWPSDVTPSGPLSAQSSDILIAELTLTMEHFEIEDHDF